MKMSLKAFGQRACRKRALSAKAAPSCGGDCVTGSDKEMPDCTRVVSQSSHDTQDFPPAVQASAMMIFT